MRECVLNKVNEVAVRVPIHRHRNDWNCQNWVIALLDRLKAFGFVPADVTESGIRNELMEQEKKWQVADLVYGETA